MWVYPRRERMKKTLTIVLALGLVAFITIPALTKMTNCGGNSAALSYTRKIAFAAIAMGYEKLQESESITAATLLKDEEFQSAITFGWGIRSYWLKEVIELNASEPIVICGELFSNVPRPALKNLFSRNPGYAAAYPSGEARILQVSEFNRIDFSAYRFISQMNFEQKEHRRRVSGN